MGGRGSGKTTKAKELVIKNSPPQVVWIDPTLQADTSPAEFVEAINRGDRMVQVGATHPDAAVAALLTTYGLSTKKRPLYVVCDEAASYLKIPRPSLARVFNMGRHAGMGVFAHHSAPQRHPPRLSRPSGPHLLGQADRPQRYRPGIASAGERTRPIPRRSEGWRFHRKNSVRKPNVR